ncbi:MAG: hypothetical protein FWD69_13360 [Polyangiaceae bacterium]|nr:hypothetical protein [Polyangiaceae bacterium]
MRRSTPPSVFGIALGFSIAACGGGSHALHEASTPRAATHAPDVRLAKERPPVVLVAREGDPASAVGVAVTTTGIDASSNGDNPEVPTALAGVVEARLEARGLAARVTPQWDGFRAVVLVQDAAHAEIVANALRAALTTGIESADLASAKKKLSALGSRPLRDAALGRWAQCTGSPYALASRAGKSGTDLTLPQLEAWRKASHGLGRVAISAVGPRGVAEATASAIARAPAWNLSTMPLMPSQVASDPSTTDVEVYAASLDPSLAQAIVHATLNVGSSSAAAYAAESLGDPHGPLATRLAALDVRLREIAGAAHAHGGCVGVVLEAAPAGPATGADLAARVANAVALIRLEADVHLAEGGTTLDGPTLARRAGDAREAAERAAWWVLVDRVAPAPTSVTRTAHASIALGVGSRQSSPLATPLEQDLLGEATAHANASWKKPVVEGRTRVEAGQGETWVLVASPCGTDGETDADAGVTALFVVASADGAKTAPGVEVEPWIVSDGAGLLVHGPAFAGETPAAHARRLADIAAESFAAASLHLTSITRARTELFRHDAAEDGPALGTLAQALSPGRPSAVVAWGRDESLPRVSDAAVIARAQALRAGPMRVAVLANVDATQGDAAIRATDRWVDRHEGARTCRPAPAPRGVRAGTYAAPTRGGSLPEALLAFPFPAADEAARAQATTFAFALDGPRGLLETALGASTGLSRESSARLLGWPHAPALVVRIASNQANLDAAVMQARALMDRLHANGLPAADLERANRHEMESKIVARLDPRARIVATWRGEPTALPQTNVDGARAFAQKYLGEETMLVIASRPGRTPIVKAAP